jgi:ABC-type lipoprotein export system ATPase subunit
MHDENSSDLVRCENLVKIYSARDAQTKVVALQGLDLAVLQGEMLAIVGRSGSGKTTLLNILGGLDVPTAGHCVVAGYNLTAMKEHACDIYRRQIVGHLWQQSGRNLLADLTIEENVNLPQMLSRISKSQYVRRSRDLLAQVGLLDMRNKLPRQLSGGEQQRAALAVALANAPNLLLADEPTGELDSMTAQEILTLLRRINRDQGVTMIIVTHDAGVAAAVDRTIAIRDGRTSIEVVPRVGVSSAETSAWATTSRGSVYSAAIGLPVNTHRESVIIDRSGWLQLPHEAVACIRFNGRGEVRVAPDHLEVWPTRTDGRIGTNVPVDARLASSSVATGLPADRYREAVLIDHVGRLQLPEEAFEHVPLGRLAEVYITGSHVELWPSSSSETV